MPLLLSYKNESSGDICLYFKFCLSKIQIGAKWAPVKVHALDWKPFTNDTSERL